MRRLILALLAVVIAGAACPGNGGGGPDPTVPTAVATTPLTTQVGIDTIPQVIDAPYLNRVLAAIDKVDTAAVRVVMEMKRVPEEAADLFNAIYADEWFSVKVDSWIDQLAKDPDLKGLKRPLGDRHTTVSRLIAATPACVFIAVNRDYSDSDVNPPPVSTEYLALQPLDPQNDPDDHNPTAWMIIADGSRADGSEPANPCRR